MSRGHQCFCSEIGHVNVLLSCVQRTFLQRMFNVIVIFIIMYEKLINETYEINELQYYTVLLYVRVRYHFVIRDSGPALKLKIHS
jgi:hypothetical protein